jgi:hypothetical protein
MSLSTIISSKLITILEEEIIKYAPEIQDAALAELKVLLGKLIEKVESIGTSKTGA